MGGVGIPLSALAAAADEEVVPFTDYGPTFQVEAQPDNPRIKSFDLRRLTSFATPSDEFFTFHQTRTVSNDARAWRLRVGGLVKRPAEFSLASLLDRPDRRDLAVTIECSGNSGDPRIMNGLVSNAVWTGVICCWTQASAASSNGSSTFSLMAVTSTRKASRDNSVTAHRCDIASRVVIDDRNDKTVAGVVLSHLLVAVRSWRKE